MITVSQCAARAGLASNELVLGAIPSSDHDALLESYMLNAHRGLGSVRAMIVSDLRAYLDLGVASRAADLLIVLRLLLTAYPEAGLAASTLAAELDAAFEAAFAAYYLDARRSRPASAGASRGPGVVLSFPREGRRADRRATLGEPGSNGRDAVVARPGSRLSLRSDR
jgi:hypothetical protein